MSGGSESKVTSRRLGDVHKKQLFPDAHQLVCCGEAVNLAGTPCIHLRASSRAACMHACRRLASAAAGKPRRRGALSISPLSIADQLWVEHL